MKIMTHWQTVGPKKYNINTGKYCWISSGFIPKTYSMILSFKAIRYDFWRNVVFFCPAIHQSCAPTGEIHKTFCFGPRIVQSWIIFEITFSFSNGVEKVVFDKLSISYTEKGKRWFISFYLIFIISITIRIKYYCINMYL